MTGTEHRDDEAADGDGTPGDAPRWVVAGAAALQFVLVGGIHKSFGLVLAALVQRHGFTAAQVSIIPATYMAVSFLVAPLCGALCRRLSERSVAMLGGLCSSLGLALSALTSDVYLLYLTNGLIFGLGQGFSNVPGTLLVTQYFVKRRGLANAIMAAAAAVLLLEEYGIPGTYLMLGGLHMHTLVSAALYRPLEKQRMIMRLDRRRCSRRLKTADRASAPIQDEFVQLDPQDEPTARRWSTAGGEHTKAAEQEALMAPAPRRRASTALSVSSAWLSQLSLMAQLPPAPAAPTGCWAQLSRLLDLRLLADPLYLACMLSVLLFSAGLPHVCLLVPRFGLEIGISRGRTANMIATVAPIDILSRLSLGLLLDRNLFHKRYGFFITCLVGGAGILALVFVRTYAGLYVACTFVYAGIGFFFVVMPVMYAEYYGVERLSSTLTMSNMFSGVANLVAQPLCGLLRDSTGSFRPVFGVLAACMLTG
ncbi:monocarboxylate transporter 7-like [Pollicipes pollicipes]|uniref:monocarboxylate transporter 7-like n=1 Tax=Pollicipes pollicipes TaxID=41117 RepID=UPI001884C5F7|nr:monocarboxylate transporter 7-like [Pollicipes pollicipes]